MSEKVQGQVLLLGSKICFPNKSLNLGVQMKPFREPISSVMGFVNFTTQSVGLHSFYGKIITPRWSVGLVSNLGYGYMVIS